MNAKFYSLLMLLNLRWISTSNLNWTAAPVGRCVCRTLEATSATLAVPDDYTNPEKEITLFIKRYKTKSPYISNHLFMIPGGPGQDETVLEPHVQSIADFVGNIAIYLVDIRGVGRSQSLVLPDQVNWMNNVSDLEKNPSYSVKSINVHNIALDVIQLAKELKEERGFKGKITLFGVSFGANIAFRALQLDHEGVFSSAIIDSIASIRGFIDPLNDSRVIKNCNDHPYCKAQFEGDANNIKKYFERMLDPGFNKCSSQLVNELSNGNGYPKYLGLGHKMYFLLQDWIEGSAEFRGTRYHSIQKVVGFIKATYQCHDPNQYKEILLEATKSKGTAYATSSSSSLGSSMNLLVNYILFAGEIYDFPSGGSNSSCSEIPNTLSHQCFLHDSYHYYFSKLKNIVSPRDPLAASTLITQAKVIFVHGAMDLVTPQPAMERLAKSVAAPIVRIYNYENRGHSHISIGPCAKFIFQEALLDHSSLRTETCLSTVNGTPLDWTFKSFPKYQKWFDRAIDAAELYVPEPSELEPNRGTPTFHLFTVFFINFIVIAIPSLFAYYYKNKTKHS